jgi:hypothetical protein
VNIKGMSAESKLKAIEELVGPRGVCLRMRKPGDWYVDCGIEVGGSGVLVGTCGNGKTPFAAINDTFSQLINLPADRYIVVDRNGMRRHYRWNDFMWSDVTHSTK